MKYLLHKIVVLGMSLFPGVLVAGTPAPLPTIDVSTKEKLARVLYNIIDFLLTIGGIVAVVMLIYAGFLFMTGAGNDDKLGTAKKILLYVVIGVGVMMLSYSAVSITNSLLNG